MKEKLLSRIKDNDRIIEEFSKHLIRDFNDPYKYKIHRNIIAERIKENSVLEHVLKYCL
jgi:hypothetical protein